MGGGFNRREPIDTLIIHQNLEVRDNLKKFNWLGFFERLRGYDDEIALDCNLNLQHFQGNYMVIVVKGLIIYLHEDRISRVTTLPKGII